MPTLEKCRARLNQQARQFLRAHLQRHCQSHPPNVIPSASGGPIKLRNFAPPNIIIPTQTSVAKPKNPLCHSRASANPGPEGARKQSSRSVKRQQKTPWRHTRLRKAINPQNPLHPPTLSAPPPPQNHHPNRQAHLPNPFLQSLGKYKNTVLANTQNPMG